MGILNIGASAGRGEYPRAWNQLQNEHMRADLKQLQPRAADRIGTVGRLIEYEEGRRAR